MFILIFHYWGRNLVTQREIILPNRRQHWIGSYFQNGTVRPGVCAVAFFRWLRYLPFPPAAVLNFKLYNKNRKYFLSLQTKAFRFMYFICSLNVWKFYEYTGNRKKHITHDAQSTLHSSQYMIKQIFIRLSNINIFFLSLQYRCLKLLFKRFQSSIEII